MEPEKKDAGSTQCVTVPKKIESFGSKKSLTVDRRLQDKLMVKDANSTTCDGEILADRSSFCEEFPIEYQAFREKTIKELSSLAKMLTELQSSKDTCAQEKRIAELERRNRDMEREIAKCFSHIDMISERQSKFKKQYSGITRHFQKSEDHSTLSQQIPVMTRPNSSKHKSFTVSRSSSKAYAKPVAQQTKSSVTNRPLKGLTTNEELSFKNKPSKAKDLKSSLHVSNNYERLMDLMKDRH